MLDWSLVKNVTTFSAQEGLVKSNNGPKDEYFTQEVIELPQWTRSKSLCSTRLAVKDFIVVLLWVDDL